MSSRGEMPSQGLYGNLCIEGSPVTIARMDSSIYPNSSCTDQICPSVELKVSEVPGKQAAEYLCQWLVDRPR